MAHETLTFRPSKKNGTVLTQLSELTEQENRSLNNYIESSLNPTFSKERIEVPASEEGSGFNGGNGFIGVDDNKLKAHHYYQQPY